MTTPGFSAGTVETLFYGRCVKPSTQRMKTVYPDDYSVLTLCDRGVQYIVSPSSRGAGCEVWSITPEQRSSLCDGVCSCPFCVRDTAGRWTTQAGGGDTPQGDVVWASGNVTGVSKVTGEPVRIWNGTLERGMLRIEYAVTPDGAPHTLLLESSLWVTTSTWFNGLNASVPDDAFEIPAICAPQRRSKSRAGVDAGVEEEVEAEAAAAAAAAAASAEPHGRTATVDVSSTASAGYRGVPAPSGVPAPDAPPGLPASFSANLAVNISQPGYDGGNVFLNFTSDCSRGPAVQVSKTTFGNFHTVLLNCAERTIYHYDLAGINCFTRSIPRDVDPRVCRTCALPFGIRDTRGVYTVDGGGDRFVFERAGGTILGEALYRGNLSTQAHNAPHTAALGMEAAFTASLSTPMRIAVRQPSWLRTSVRFSRVVRGVRRSQFDPPACFRPSPEPAAAGPPVLLPLGVPAPPPQAPAGAAGWEAVERSALIDLASSTGVQHWLHRRNWLSRAHHVCEWELVGCDAERRVKVLALSFNNMSGALPPSVAQLQRLQDLDVEHNHLSGRVPSEIGSMRALVQLGLGGNRFTGALPPQLCPVLWRLTDAAPTGAEPPCDLSGNAFACPLPCEEASAGCGATCANNSIIP